MINKRTLAAVVVLGLAMAGCGSSPAAAPVTTTAVRTVVTTAPTVTVVSTITATETATEKEAAPTSDTASADVCLQAANELTSDGIGALMEKIIAKKEVTRIELSGPVTKYMAINGRSATTLIAHWVAGMNEAAADLNGVIFTLWTGPQQQAILTAYLGIKSSCMDAGFDWIVV